jgi:hypothetical protein
LVFNAFIGPHKRLDYDCCTGRLRGA